MTNYEEKINDYIETGKEKITDFVDQIKKDFETDEGKKSLAKTFGFLGLVVLIWKFFQKR